MPIGRLAGNLHELAFLFTLECAVLMQVSFG